MKAKNPEQRAKNVTSAISNVRSIKNEFNMTDLVIALKSAQCPYPADVASILKKKNIITKRNGIYTFSSPDPVHYKTIINDLEEVYLRYKPKTSSKQVKNTVSLTIEDAIALLKSQGYKILKPIFTEI